MNRTFPKVSIIIPVWNTEKYLQRCINSVLAQSHQNMEIICINDASPDNSDKILADYASADDRIRIITNKRNKGLSAVRNAGLEASLGEYIYFLDSDDWIDVDRMEIMMYAMIMSDLDVVYNDTLFEIRDGAVLPHPNMNKFKYGDYVSSQYTAWMVPAYMFKRDFFLHTSPFPPGLKHEDTYFYWTAIRSLPQIYTVTGGAYYYFRDNESSIMAPVLKKCVYDYDIIEILRLIFKYYCTNPIGDTTPLPLGELYSYFFIAANPKEFFLRLKKLFAEIRFFIMLHEKLYDPDDIEYIQSILDVCSVDELLISLKNLEKRKVFAKLRKHIYSRECINDV
jgi:glycosyltransferase involved in cell wall biosynthesis